MKETGDTISDMASEKFSVSEDRGMRASLNMAKRMGPHMYMITLVTLAKRSGDEVL